MSGEGLLVSNSELIDTFTRNGAWALVGKTNGYALNAGSVFTFPWLGSVARLYEKYKFEYISFRLQSQNPVTHSGRVFMKLDTDPTDPAPQSAARMDAATPELRASSVVHKECEITLGKQACQKYLHDVVDRAFTKRYSGADDYPRSSTVGRLFIAAETGQLSTFSLRVVYKVRLFQPQLNEEAQLLEHISAAETLNKTGGERSGIPALIQSGEATAVNLAGTATQALDLTRAGKLLEFAVGAATPTTLKDWYTNAYWDVTTAGVQVLDRNLNLIADVYGVGNILLRRDQHEVGRQDKATSAAGHLMTIATGALLTAYPAARFVVPVFTWLVTGTYAPRFSIKTEL